MKICPRCKQRYSHNSYDVDIIHTCNSGNNALDQEDTLDITKTNWNLKGIGNKIFGGHGAIKGKKVYEVTDRGNKSELVKTEQHEEYIDLTNQ